MTTRQIEAARQEKETFEERKRQSRQWFALRLYIGYGSLILLLSVFVVCIVVIARAVEYPPAAVVGASSVLFGDVIALVATVWKIAFNPGLQVPLEPITAYSDDESPSQAA